MYCITIIIITITFNIIKYVTLTVTAVNNNNNNNKPYRNSNFLFNLYLYNRYKLFIMEAIIRMANNNGHGAYKGPMDLFVRSIII